MLGETPEKPLHFSQVLSSKRELIETIELTVRIFSAVYILWSMWALAKAMRPQLAVQEKLAIEALKQQFGKAKRIEPIVPREWIRAIYDDTRDGMS